MTTEEWLCAVDGLLAYYSGCTDSGIRDYRLTEQVREHWNSIGLDGQRGLILALAESLLQKEGPYGPEDLKEYLDWIYDEDFA